MQTFLPYADFDATAHVLDGKRLWKQRVETLQIMTALTEGRGWIHHPAVKMWEGFERALLEYQWAIVQEGTVARGYTDNVCWEKTEALVANHVGFFGPVVYPPWLGDPAFHLAHQSNLLRKNYEFYSEWFNVPDDLPYIWPVVSV